MNKKSMKKFVDKSLKFSTMGSNAAGLKAKIDSLQHVLQLLYYPSCVTIQETKMACSGKIKIDGYEIFEKIRNAHGGGLLKVLIESILYIDYIVTCGKLAAYLELMLIDDKRTLTLTKYASTKEKGKKIVKSDHNVLLAQFALQYGNNVRKKVRT